MKGLLTKITVCEICQKKIWFYINWFVDILLDKKITMENWTIKIDTNHLLFIKHNNFIESKKYLMIKNYKKYNLLRRSFL